MFFVPYRRALSLVCLGAIAFGEWDFAINRKVKKFFRLVLRDVALATIAGQRDWPQLSTSIA